MRTNRDALRSVLAHADFARGAVTTRWLEERSLSRRDRDRRHHDPRRQPEPVGRDRADHARRAGDRPGDGSRRLPRARLHLQHPHGRLRALPPRGPVGAAAAGRAAMPNTPLSMITTGKRFISWRPAREDVQRARVPAARSATGCGGCRSPIRPTTRTTSRRWPRSRRAEGVEEVVIGLTYSVSPVHTDAVLRRARGGRWPPARRRPALPQGPRRAGDVERLRELAPPSCAAGARP